MTTSTMIHSVSLTLRALGGVTLCFRVLWFLRLLVINQLVGKFGFVVKNLLCESPVLGQYPALMWEVMIYNEQAG